MRKFLTVVKREYVQRVRAKMFIVSTILLPLVMSLFGIVPAVIMNIDTPPVRVAVVDQTGKMYPRLKQALFNDDSNQETRNDNTAERRIAGRSSFGSFVLEQSPADQSI